jgi:hypothetical protein
MPERHTDLEIHRDIFIHQLTQTLPNLVNYQEFLRYWKAVETEAMHTEDLGMLDEWVRDLSRDKEKVAALKNRTDTMGDQEGVQNIVQILKIVLDIIEGIERRLRRLRDERLSALASMLWKGGPGTTAKPKPDKKDQKEKRGPAEGVLENDPNAAAAMKPPEPRRDKDKKLER